jgi:hypothetical protein
MPSANRHLRQAQHNEFFAGHLLAQDGVPFSDWAVTAAFYAALHYVNHYFMRTAGVAPGSHDLRTSYLNRDSHAKSIAGEFQMLRDRCDEARYYCRCPTSQVIRALLDNELQVIKRAMVS